MATNTDNLLRNEIGRAFVQRHQANVMGILHGWDRLRLQGTLRSLYYPPVMEHYLRRAGVMWKDFKDFATGLTDRIRKAAEEVAKKQQRPVIYLASSRASKEDEARQIQQRDGVRTGLIAIMSCVEPCRRWCMRGNRASKKLELSIEWGKCIHLYFYWIHEELGFLHLRLQTWFPFLIQVCVNGREWLGRQMDTLTVSGRAPFKAAFGPSSVIKVISVGTGVSLLNVRFCSAFARRSLLWEFSSAGHCSRVTASPATDPLVGEPLR